MSSVTRAADAMRSMAIASALTFFACTAAAGAAPRQVRPPHRLPARPSTACTAQLFAYTPPSGEIYGISHFAFDPTGAAWFVDGENDVERYSTSGVQTLFTVKRALPIGAKSISSAGIAYANDRMWFDAVGGFEGLKLDGTGRAFRQSPAGESEVVGTTAGGSLWLVEKNRAEPGYAMVRLDPSGTTARFPIAPVELPFYSQLGPDGLVYSYYYNEATNVHGVVRVNADGSETHYVGATLGAFANGGLYYSVGGEGTQQLMLAFLSLSTGTTTFTPLYGFTLGDIYNITAGPGGTLWFAGLVGPLTGVTHTELFSYDPIAQKIGGPYEPSVLDNIGSTLGFAPDGSLYLTQYQNGRTYVARYDCG